MIDPKHALESPGPDLPGRGVSLGAPHSAIRRSDPGSDALISGGDNFRKPRGPHLFILYQYVKL